MFGLTSGVFWEFMVVYEGLLEVNEWFCLDLHM